MQGQTPKTRKKKKNNLPPPSVGDDRLVLPNTAAGQNCALNKTAAR
jgi:hypothetical protein